MKIPIHLKIKESGNLLKDLRCGQNRLLISGSGEFSVDFIFPEIISSEEISINMIDPLFNPVIQESVNCFLLIFGTANSEKREISELLSSYLYSKFGDSDRRAKLSVLEISDEKIFDALTGEVCELEDEGDERLKFPGCSSIDISTESFEAAILNRMKTVRSSLSSSFLYFFDFLENSSFSILECFEFDVFVEERQSAMVKYGYRKFLSAVTMQDFLLKRDSSSFDFLSEICDSSILTRILKEVFLYGNCIASVLCCLSQEEPEKSKRVMEICELIAKIETFPVGNDGNFLEVSKRLRRRISVLKKAALLGSGETHNNFDASEDIKELKSLVSILEEKFFEEKNLADKLETENSEFHEKIEDLKDKLRNVHAEKIDISQQLFDTEERRIKLCEDLVEYQRNFQQIEIEFKTTKNELTLKISELDEETKSLRSRLSSEEMELDRKNRKVENLESERQSVLELKEKLSSEQNNNDELSQEIIRLCKEKLELTSSLQFCNEDLKVAKNRLGEQEGKISFLEKSIDEERREKSLRTSERDVFSVELQKDKLVSTAKEKDLSDEFSRKLKILEDAKLDITRQLNFAKQEVDRLQDSLKLTKRTEERKVSIESLQESLDHFRSEIQKYGKTKGQTLDALFVKLIDLQKKSTEKEKENFREIEDMHHHLQTIREQYTLIYRQFCEVIDKTESSAEKTRLIEETKKSFEMVNALTPRNILKPRDDEIDRLKAQLRVKDEMIGRVDFAQNSQSTEKFQNSIRELEEERSALLLRCQIAEEKVLALKKRMEMLIG